MRWPNSASSRVSQEWVNPSHAEVAGVDFEQGTGFGGDGGLIVGYIGAVGGSHLHETGTALGQHIGNAEASADFNSLATGYDDFLPLGDGTETEEDGGCVVVDDQG